MPTVLITGASRGIGRAVATGLAQSGFEVYAGFRSDVDAAALQAAGLRPIRVDLTDQATVDALPAAIGGRLDALVNNAGIAVSGPVEALPLDDLRHQLEVNVTGQVAVTQAMLPALRTARGRVAFIGSVSGRVATPLLGAYAASKFALEGLVDALRVEVRPWGIRVALIEPGSIDTDIWRTALETADQMEAALSPTHRELYGGQVAAVRRLAVRVQGQAAPTEKVVRAVRAALTDRRPKARYVVGTDARVQLAGRGLLPTPAWDAVLARISGVR